MQHAEAFAQAGLYFPKTGWYGVVPGHHALAWEIANQDRGPIFSELLDEIRGADPNAIVLSAEDFSLLYSRPRALVALREGLHSIGYEPRILVYLRAQGPFCESMYVERVKHDHIRPLRDFLAEVIESGCYTGANLPLEFRYSRMLAVFEEVFGREHITARIYEGRRDLTRVFNDYLVTISQLAGIFQNATVELEITHPIINESLSFAHLLGTAYSRLVPGPDVPATAKEFMAKWAPELPDDLIEKRFTLLRRSDHVALLHAFADDNRAVLAKYGVAVPFMSEADIPAINDLIWIFTDLERTIYDRCIDAWIAEGRA